jgi:hypothetical protein
LPLRDDEKSENAQFSASDFCQWTAYAVWLKVESDVNLNKNFMQHCSPYVGNACCEARSKEAEKLNEEHKMKSTESSNQQLFTF